MYWKTIRRSTGLIEHVCEHGVGHPNFYSIHRLNELYGQTSYGVHGCDRCCENEDFPGRQLTSTELMDRLEEKVWGLWLDGHDIRDWIAFTLHDDRINQRLAQQ